MNPERNRMKALTIIQPFAELVASGDKKVENRTWYTSYRGPLAIHAGKAKRYGGDDVFEISEDWYDIPRSSLVFGAVIAIANLVACVRLGPPKSNVPDPVTFRPPRPSVPDAYKNRFPWLEDHEHTEGPVCWVLENVRRIEPVTIDGSRGLWDWMESEQPITTKGTP